MALIQSVHYELNAYYLCDCLIAVFNFTTGRHTVAEVTKSNFDSCNVNQNIQLLTAPPVRFTLNRTGEFYFACSIPGHCNSGQKLSVKATGSSPAPGKAPSPAHAPSPHPPPPVSGTSPTPSPNEGAPPPSSPSETPPPSPSSATSLAAAATFSLLLTATVANLLF